MSSYPCALIILKECIALRISWSFNEIDDKLALVKGDVTRGKMLLFETGVDYWDEKKTLKWFASSSKFDISLFLLLYRDLSEDIYLTLSIWNLKKKQNGDLDGGWKMKKIL